MHHETATVRKGEEFDVAGLAEYLTGKIEGAERGIEVEQFPGGHSNLTYLLRAGGQEYVLRRGPLGPVPPKAHDMARECRVLSAVHPHFPEAPKSYHLCEDPKVIGAVFFVMERRRGHILRDSVPQEIASIPDYPERISQAFIDCIARLHAIDAERHGLLALGRPEGFVERQVHGWTERWHRAKTEELPAMNEVIAWLERNLPPSGQPALVHNDFKLDNVMLFSSPRTTERRDGVRDPCEVAAAPCALKAGEGEPIRIGAVLDWEMATVGDPLADFGLTLCYWAWAPAVPSTAVSAMTVQPGWYTRDQLVSQYAEKTGRDMRSIGYHEVLGVFKLAVIIQQIYYRYHRGQTTDERFCSFGARAKGLVDLAARMAAGR
jgi:aminoglycoside phosphotransferase (APT) family kinase protein